MSLKRASVWLSIVLGLPLVALAGAPASEANPALGPAVGAEPIDRVDYSDHAYVEAEAWTLDELASLDRLGENLSCRPRPGAQPLIIERARLALLDGLGIRYRVVEPNVQTVLDERAAEARAARTQRDATFYTTWRDITEISDLIDLLETTNPAIATRVSVGTSVEGREIFGIRIKGASAPADAPVVVINGCQHAREWLSPMSVCYAAEQLVTQYGVDPQITDLVDSVEFHFVPVVNPDGYVYSWSSERFWRKNRRNNGNGTFGVDLNRNWSLAWGGAGSSGTTSSETYRGPNPFSEPETAALSAYMESVAGGAPCTVGVDCGDGDECTHVKAHLDIHTHASLILGPWGWTDTIAPPREAELREVQEAMQAAMTSENGETYTAGLGVDQLLYIADGICPDWTFGVLGALAWTYELRPAGGGLAGFDPPVSDILPGCTETFAGILVLAESVKAVGLELGVTSAPTTIEVGAGGATVEASALAKGDCDLSVSAVTLYWREQGAGTFSAVPMSDTGSAYEAALPDQACGTIVEYYVEASGNGGESVTDPADAPATLLTAEAIEIVLSADDDFESDTGWTVGEPDDTATTGLWTRVDPEGTSSGGSIVQPADDSSTDGTLCWVTDGAAGASAGANDVDGGKTTLLSPVFDLSATDNAAVSFDLWYSNSAGGAPNADTFRVDVTSDGSTWVNALTVGPGGAATDGGWIPYAFQVESVVALSSTVQLRFVAEDAGTGSLVEAAIDEFRIRESQDCLVPPGCAGDLDGDGDTDVFDFTIFAQAFGSMTGDPSYLAAADFDGSGLVDVLDFATFATDFGCLPAAR